MAPHPSTGERRTPVIRKVLRYGSATSIPDFDVCRLSFYLKCCIVGCDIMNSAINISIFDYNNAHRMPGQLQYFILNLALHDFGLERLINRVIFLDDQHKLLPYNVSNAFFAIETASNYFEVLEQNPPLDGVSDGHVRKAMLCTTKWINEIYIRSLSSLQKSFHNAPLGLLELRDSLHCFHCRGMDAHCTCEIGCQTSFASCCSTLHRGATCTTCERQQGYISAGPRYRCIVCSDTSLCERCYISGEHDQTHGFEKILRPSTLPVYITPQAFELTVEDDAMCDSQQIPVAVAVPIETAMHCEDA